MHSKNSFINVLPVLFLKIFTYLFENQFGGKRDLSQSATI